MTIGCDVAFFLPLLQGGPRLTFNTQGSAKPPPWAKSCNRFAVENSHTARERRHRRERRERKTPSAKRGAVSCPQQPAPLFDILLTSRFSPLTVLHCRRCRRCRREYPDHSSKSGNQLR